MNISGNNNENNKYYIGIFVFIVVATFLFIVALKSGAPISQQNNSNVVISKSEVKVKPEVDTNPYTLAYNKCTHPKMAEYYEKKCIAWELNKDGK